MFLMFTDLVPVKSERDKRPSETQNRQCASLRGKHASAKPFGNKKVFRRVSEALGGLQHSTGGEGGIRTPDTVARMPHFECGAFNHSATSPRLSGR